MEESPQSLELRDIPDVAPLLPRAWWPWWAWLGIAMSIVLLWWLQRYLRRQSGSQASLRLKAYEEAMLSLEGAKSLADPVSRSTALSLALRRYLAVVFADPALYETHEELLSRHEAFGALPDTLRHSLGEHFSTLCRYKYAPCEEVVNLSLLIPQATTLLQQIHAIDSGSIPAAP
jgi:hypothetical protein